MNSSEGRRAKRKQLKLSIAKDREAHWDAAATKLEHTARVGDTRKLSQTLKRATGQKKRGASGVKAADETLLTDKNDIIERWAEHFERLLIRIDHHRRPLMI